MTHPVGNRARHAGDTCCDDDSPQSGREAAWHRLARWARRLAWVSLAAMLTEGAVGLWQGLAVGSIALTGWALGSAPEALASAMVIWRFSGVRTLSATSERRAQRGVALSFWLTAPYIAAESVRDLFGAHRAETSRIGIAVTGIALVLMPVLGRAKRNLALRLGSPATAGEATQNYLCAAQAAAVLVGLSLSAAWPGGRWCDPVIGLGIAAVAAWQGIRSWRGEDCGC
ncbi:MAG: cation transporter [Mycobacterium sp.]|uniref:cation transporter n=1 Tax=Mycobacterium sp. TaxID=1785 RepID=UPI002625E29E|nr:cation transporter [Mycobacterium sp.]MDI3314816.1 cation transporter [Mycobacterium sp.]